MFSYVILKKQGYRVLIVEHNLFLYKVDEEKQTVMIHAVVDGRQEYRNHVSATATLCRQGVGVDPLDGFADAQPEGQIGEHLHDAALVREGRFLEDGEVFQ